MRRPKNPRVPRVSGFPGFSGLAGFGLHCSACQNVRFDVTYQPEKTACPTDIPVRRSGGVLSRPILIKSSL